MPSKKIVTLCDWEKSAYTPKKMTKVVGTPKFFCEKCGRSANKKTILCKPEKLPDPKK
jgi:hypothetical protein